jgi:putative drug exporter of the RND superfamily
VASLARWCYRHRVITVLLWVVALVGLGGASRALGSAYSDSFTLPGTESSKALDLLASAFPREAGDSDQIVWHVADGSVRDAAVRDRIGGMLRQVESVPQVAEVRSPYTADGAGQISADGKTAYATVGFTAQAEDLDKANIRRVIDIAQAARSGSLQVELGGNAIQQVNENPPSSSEGIGVAAAAVVLFLAFGSLLATLLPLVVAIVALGAGLSAAGLLAHAATITTVAPTLAALIGLGVGIDYALFIVTRHRNGLKAGMSPEDSVVRALDTSGRAVLFAGMTVCIALLGLLVLGVGFLNGMGVVAALVVVFTVATATTLLPALLGFMKMRVLSRRERRRLAAQGPIDEHASGRWARWSRLVQRRSPVLAAVAIVVLAVLALPTLSLRLGSSDAGNDPASSTTRKAYDLLADGFGPGFNGPLQLVAEVHSDADRAAAARLATTLRSVPRGRRASRPRRSRRSRSSRWCRPPRRRTPTPAS